MNPAPTTPPGGSTERVPLVRLAAQRGGAASPALTRVVSNGIAQQRPGRVAVAAFQSSV